VDIGEGSDVRLWPAGFVCGGGGQYLSVPHRVLQDSQESPGILRNPQESSGILRTHAGLHYDFADFKF
jgi:hypothetical protein